MVTPEQRARELIDAQLGAAGWVIQDRDQLDRRASLGVAVREYPMANGPTDYLLLIDGKACGTVDAKKEGFTLTPGGERRMSLWHLHGHAVGKQPGQDLVTRPLILYSAFDQGRTHTPRQPPCIDAQLR